MGIVIISPEIKKISPDLVLPDGANTISSNERFLVLYFAMTYTKEIYHDSSSPGCMEYGETIKDIFGQFESENEAKEKGLNL